MHYTVIVLTEVIKICFFNREILEATFTSVTGSPERECTAEVGDFRVLFNLQ